MFNKFSFLVKGETIKKKNAENKVNILDKMKLTIFCGINARKTRILTKKKNSTEGIHSFLRFLFLG